MADYITQGNKTIQCKQGHVFSVSFQTTLCKCPTCDCNVCVYFHGVVIDKHGNYIY